ncbi:MAG TPA: nucleotidyltransferase family protein [Vicinamibacteria bacterium]|jgi:dTDP-glucose pyrophosphorylase
MSNHLEACRLRHSATLVEAMRSLEKSGIEIALIVDDRDRLVGTLTDGDVRRALLKGATLESVLLPHLQRNFTAVGPKTGRAEVLDLMQSRTISQIPIVDVEGRLVGIHLLHEVLGAIERPNWAVVMAGGQGTRLRPLTETIPKPMIRVAGRPILERIVLHLVSFGIRHVFLSINYLGNVIEDHFGDGSRFGCRIRYIREEKALGTGGALAELPSAPTLPLVVMNGDLITQADIGAMLEYHAAGGQEITLGVRRYSHTVPFGCVDLEGERVVRMEEKPQLSVLVNAGIYVLNPGLVARIPRGHEFPLPGLLEQCLSRGEAVAAFEIEDDWIDVGQRDQLKQARGIDV